MVSGDTPAMASTSAIPFGQAPATPVGGSAGGFLLAFVLLGVAFLVLWFIRRRGYGAASHALAVAPGTGWTVAQRIRLTPTAQAIVLRDGSNEVLVVESRHGVQLTHIDARDAGR